VSSDSTVEQYTYRDPRSPIRGYVVAGPSSPVRGFGAAGTLGRCFAAYDAGLLDVRSTHIGAGETGVHTADDNQ